MRGWRSPKSASIRSFVIISVQTKSRMAAPGAVFLSSPSNTVGEWLSLVEHLVRDQGVGGSNPLSPTNYPKLSRDKRGPSLRSGFRLRAQTPANRLKFKSSLPD